MVGPRVGSGRVNVSPGRVGSTFRRVGSGQHFAGSGRVNVSPGRIGSGQRFAGSGQRFAGSGRVQEKWPVDNSGSRELAWPPARPQKRQRARTWPWIRARQWTLTWSQTRKRTLTLTRKLAWLCMDRSTKNVHAVTRTVACSNLWSRPQPRTLDMIGTTTEKDKI